MNFPQWLGLLLWPLSVIYGDLARLRARLYASGRLKSRRLSVPVISVGNLTVGGTGKTPMVLWLAEHFLSQGRRVGILSRGYKGNSGTSDEIELMKSRLQDRALFGVGPDRFAAAQPLLQQGVDIFLLDDGFQHMQLSRDVNILLMDATQPLARESLLPAGNLREPVSAMQRADILVITRADAAPATQAAVAKLGDYPVFSACTRLLGFRRLGCGIQLLPLEAIGPGPFYAFCGIGNPSAFFHDLRSWNLPVSHCSEFPDHHKYDARDLGELSLVAQTAGAKAFLTTEKDAQNLAGLQFNELPVFIAVIDLEISNPSAFLSAINQRLQSRSAAA